MGAKVIEGRMTADAEGDAVVFLVGMRINSWRAVRSWVPVLRAMPRMMKELGREKGSGLIGYRATASGLREFSMIQYWESREKLLAYASDGNMEHRPAWAAYNRSLKRGRGKVGIWHETYVVPAGSYEAIYADMPAYGLAAATGVTPVGRRGERAADRLAKSGV